MIKVVLISILFLFSLTCQATSCVVTDDAVAKWSEKFKKRIAISVVTKKSSLFVQATFPEVIENLEFSDAFAVKGSMDKPDFVMPLSVFRESGKILAWYSISPTLIKNNIITINYGNSCGISMEYQVEYNKPIKQD